MLADFQPYKFSSQVFNMRKLGELSHHLTCAEQWGELNNSVLCNAAWLFHKIQAFSIKGNFWFATVWSVIHKINVISILFGQQYTLRRSKHCLYISIYATAVVLVGHLHMSCNTVIEGLQNFPLTLIYFRDLKKSSVGFI